MLYRNKNTNMMEFRCELCNRKCSYRKTVLHIDDEGRVRSTCKGACDQNWGALHGQDDGWYELNQSFLYYLAVGSKIPVSDVDGVVFPETFKVDPA
jgi:hypothetical protein